MKKFIALLFLIVFSFTTHAEDISKIQSEDVNFCDVLAKEITDKPFNPSWMSLKILAVTFKEDLNKYSEQFRKGEKFPPRAFKRTSANNIILDYVDEKISDDFSMIRAGTEISEINGRLVKKMTASEIADVLYTELDSYRIKYYDSKEDIFKEVEIEVKETLLNDYFMDLSEKVLIDINSLDATHTANVSIDANYHYYKSRNPNVIDRVQTLFTNYKNNPSADTEYEDSFQCDYYDSTFNKMGLENPNISLTNLIKSEPPKNKFGIGFTEGDDTVTIGKKITFNNAVFKNNFEFAPFPLDSQNLSYVIDIGSDGRRIYPVLDFYPFFASSTFKNNIAGWTHSSIDYNISAKHTEGYSSNTITFLHKFERNSTYYFFKVILPIIIILIVSWGVFWIKPAELESRLTVSIVCLLSLIAYTFIIDNDVPKLSYLTFMDYIVLTSYFFSVIPTIQTIYIHYLVNKTSNAKLIKDVEIFDSYCRKYVPLAYVGFIFVIFYFFISGSPNVVNGFSIFLN